MDAISQTIFSGAFSWMRKFEFRLKFHWSLFLRVQLTIFQHWFRQWLGADQATSHYLNQWWLFYWRIFASLGLNELIEQARCHHDSSPSKLCCIMTLLSVVFVQHIDKLKFQTRLNEIWLTNETCPIWSENLVKNYETTTLIISICCSSITTIWISL